MSDLLRAIGRQPTGRAYELLGQALDRLVATTVKTNIRAEDRREATFSWLDGWTQLVDERTERSRGMTIELSNWLFEKSGAEGQYRRFKFEITKIAERDALPGYALSFEQPEGEREPLLRMRRRSEDEAKTPSAKPSKARNAPAPSPSHPDRPTLPGMSMLPRWSRGA